MFHTIRLYLKPSCLLLIYLTQLGLVHEACAITPKAVKKSFLPVDSLYSVGMQKLNAPNSSQYQSFTLNQSSTFDDIQWNFYTGLSCSTTPSFQVNVGSAVTGGFTLDAGKTYAVNDSASYHICNAMPDGNCTDELDSIQSVKVIYSYHNGVKSYGQCYNNVGNGDKLSHGDSDCTSSLTCSFTGSYNPDVLNSWVNVGAAGFSAGGTAYESLAIDSAGTPYVAYQDAANSYKATVMKFDGTSWQVVGSAGFSAGLVLFESLAIDSAGTPYLAYYDGANSYKATVMKFDGTSWQVVGTAGFSAGDTAYESLAIDSAGTPYVAYQDGANSRKATVMKFNGTSWQVVGTAGFSAGDADYESLAIDSAGTPYVAYEDYGNSYKATVMKFNN